MLAAIEEERSQRTRKLNSFKDVDKAFAVEKSESIARHMVWRHMCRMTMEDERVEKMLVTSHLRKMRNVYVTLMEVCAQDGKKLGFG